VGSEDPFGGIDLPTPAVIADVPKPKPGAAVDPFGEIDLPSPAGAVDLPRPKAEDDFSDLDLPTPAIGVTDLPKPSAAASDMNDAFGEIDLPLPTSGFADLPIPSVGVSDLPTPAAGVADLPTPAAGVADLPTPTAGVADLPTPSAGVTDLPEPAAGVVDVPDLTDELDFGHLPDSRPPRAHPPVAPPAGRDRVAASGSTDFGEIDLSDSDDVGSDEFDAFPTRSDDDDLASREDRDSFDLAVDPHEPKRRGSLYDEAVPADAQRERERKSGVKFEGRRKLERQKRRGKIVLLLILVVFGLGGASLTFTPWGPFGAYAIVKLLPSASSDKVIAQVADKCTRRLQNDTIADVDEAIRELDGARKELLDDEDLRLLGVFLHNWHQLRFGESKQHDAAATKLLGSINLEESQSRFALLAGATRNLLTLKIPKAIQDLNKGRDKSADALAVAVEAHLLAGEPDKALAKAKKLAAKEKSARAAFQISRALIQAGKRAEAIAELEQAVTAHTKHSDTYLTLAALLIEEHDRDRDRIESLLAHVLESSGEQTSPAQRARAHALEGKLHFVERQYTEAASEFDLASKLDPQDVVMLVGRGQLALLNDELPAASSAFIKALARDPTYLGALLGQAETMTRQGGFNEAKTSLTEILSKHPKSGRAHYLLGRIELALKNYASAEKELNTAIALAKDLIEAYVALSELYMKTDRDQEAMRILDAASETVPGSALIKLTLADGHAARGDYASAIIELNKAVDLEPDNVRAYFRMGQMYRKMGSYQDADLAFQEVAKRAPNHPGLALEQGLLLELNGKVDEAIAAYERALAAKPEDTAAKVRIGAASLLVGKYDRAKEILTEAVEAEPRSAEANYFLGEVCRVTGAPAEAKAYLEQAVDLDEANHLYHLRLGATLLELRDMPKALRELERARDLEPKFAETHMRIGELRLRSGAARDAIAELDKAIELDPKLAQAYALAGEALEQLADLRGAVVYYRRAVKEIPDSAELQFKLGTAELQASGFNAAAGSLSRAVTLAEKMEERPDWLLEAYYRLATTLGAMGRRQAAIDACKRYLELAPEKAIDRAEVQALLDQLGGA